MLNLRKNINVMYELLRLNALHTLEYRINFISDTLVRFIEFAVFFYFWKAIFGAQGSIPGWDLTGLLVLYAFQQLFISFFLTFAAGVHHIENEITRGGIDKYLCRPIQPWFVLMGEHSFFAVGRWINGFGALAIAHFVLGVPVFTPVFPLLMLMVFLASLITAFFGLFLGSLAFWYGRIHLFEYISEAFWEFDSYPITLFPGFIQTLSSFILPFRRHHPSTREYGNHFIC